MSRRRQLTATRCPPPSSPLGRLRGRYPMPKHSRLSRSPEVCSPLTFPRSTWSLYRPCQVPRRAPRPQVQQPLQSGLRPPRQHHHPHLHDGSCPVYVNQEHYHFRSLYTHSPNLALPFPRKAILTPDPADKMSVPQDPLSADFPLCALYTGQSWPYLFSLSHSTPHTPVFGGGLPTHLCYVISLTLR